MKHVIHFSKTPTNFISSPKWCSTVLAINTTHQPVIYSEQQFTGKQLNITCIHHITFTLTIMDSIFINWVKLGVIKFCIWSLQLIKEVHWYCGNKPPEAASTTDS